MYKHKITNQGTVLPVPFTYKVKLSVLICFSNVSHRQKPGYRTDHLDKWMDQICLMSKNN